MCFLIPLWKGFAFLEISLKFHFRRKTYGIFGREKKIIHSILMEVISFWQKGKQNFGRNFIRTQAESEREISVFRKIIIFFRFSKFYIQGFFLSIFIKLCTLFLFPETWDLQVWRRARRLSDWECMQYMPGAGHCLLQDWQLFWTIFPRIQHPPSWGLVSATISAGSMVSTFFFLHFSITSGSLY